MSRRVPSKNSIRDVVPQQDLGFWRITIALRSNARTKPFIISEEIADSRPARRRRACDPRDESIELGGDPGVAMMQTADLGDREHATALWPFNLTRRGRVPIERQVGP